MKKVIWFTLLMMGCIEPYVPPEIGQAEAILVIDGHIDYTRQSTITLSRTQNLDETGTPERVDNALVTLENENGTIYPLTEARGGKYLLDPFSIAPVKYRLVVHTLDGKEYTSEFVEVKDSPPIDSVSWEINPDAGVAISVSTHQNNSEIGYYQWKFDETWIYTSGYYSVFDYSPQIRDAVYRKEDIFHCWKTRPSTDLYATSSSRLSENTIVKFPLITIGQSDLRLKHEYSVLVKQYAITADAYGYLKELKKTTEDLGTLFSPMPSQVTGNFSCITNPEEKVLGYFSIGAVTEKRIFISALKLPSPDHYDSDEICSLNTMGLSAVATFNYNAYILINSIPNPNGPGIIGYYYTSIPCGDCRKGGGTNIKPDYWP